MGQTTRRVMMFARPTWLLMHAGQLIMQELISHNMMWMEMEFLTMFLCFMPDITKLKEVMQIPFGLINGLFLVDLIIRGLPILSFSMGKEFSITPVHLNSEAIPAQICVV